MKWRLVDTSRVDVLPKGFNSPVPQPEDLRPELWERPRALHGIDFSLDDQFERLAGLAPHARDYRHHENPMYGPLDGAVLHALMRSEPPDRVVELGSGATTRIIREARQQDHAVFDPYGTEGKRVKAQDVSLDVFASLHDGDVLFVDTTHIVRTGGDVNRIVLDVLPRLAEGVRVHFHDIVLPWEADRRWLENGWYWTEQDLLQAFLHNNADWRIDLAVHALTRERDVRSLFPAHRPEHLASAFWLRRVRSSR